MLNLIDNYTLKKSLKIKLVVSYFKSKIVILHQHVGKQLVTARDEFSGWTVHRAHLIQTSRVQAQPGQRTGLWPVGATEWTQNTADDQRDSEEQISHECDPSSCLSKI